MGDTKERIVLESLRLFSEKGYGEVTVAQIAGAVGIKPPSIYKHYSGKRAIFEAILERMSSRYRGMVASFGIDGDDASADSPVFDSMDGRNIVEMGVRLFEFFLRDNEMARFRRMLTIGRFSDPELDRIFQMQYVDLPIAYQSKVFETMLRSRGLDGDPEALALEFYAPMHLLLISCDTDESRVSKALQTVRSHIESFGRIHFEVTG